jgi:hypothetical protein
VSLLRKTELVGAVNMGVGYFELPAELPRPDIFRRSEFRARRVFYGDITDFLGIEALAAIDRMEQQAKSMQEIKKPETPKPPESNGNGLLPITPIAKDGQSEQATAPGHNGHNGYVDPMASLDTDFTSWRDRIKNGLEWKYIAIIGKDTPRRVGIRRYVIFGILPPGYTFGPHGKYKIASVKKPPHIFRILCTFIPNPIATSFKTWEQYRSEREKLNAQPLTRDQERAIRRQWKDLHGTRPYRYYTFILPGVASPSEQKAVDRIRIGAAAALFRAEELAVKAASAEVSESANRQGERIRAKMSDQISRQQGIIASLTERAQTADLEAETRGRAPPNLGIIPQAPDTVIASLPPPANPKKKRSTTPGQYNWVLELLMIFVGVVAGLYGNNGVVQGLGLLLFAGGIVLAYLDHSYFPSKEHARLMAVGAADTIAKAGGRTAEKVEDRV